MDCALVKSSSRAASLANGLSPNSPVDARYPAQSLTFFSICPELLTDRSIVLFNHDGIRASVHDLGSPNGKIQSRAISQAGPNACDFPDAI